MKMLLDSSNNGNIAAGSVTILNSIAQKIIDETHEKISEFIGTRTQMILSNQPKLTRRMNRINGRTKTQPRASLSLTNLNLMGLMPYIPSPVDIKISENSLSYSAIISQFSDEEEIDGVKVGSIDIWSEGNISKFNDGTGGGGYFGSVFAGIDIMATHDLLLGISLGVDAMSHEYFNSITKSNSTGFMVGPYALLKLDDNFYVDMSASWGKSYNKFSPSGTYSDNFISDRLLVSASVIGEFEIDNWTITPTISAQFFAENQQEYIDGLGNIISAQNFWQGDISFAPRLAYNHELEDNANLVTWVELSGNYSFNSADASSYTAPNLKDLNAAISAGINLTTNKGIDIAISTRYDGIGKAQNSYGISLNLRAPLN